MPITAPSLPTYRHQPSRDAGFDRDARHPGRQHRVAIRLRFWRRTGWCRASTRRAPGGRALPARAPRPPRARLPSPSRSGRNPERRPAREHVAAARDRRELGGVPLRRGSACRVEDQARRCRRGARPRRPRQRGLDGVAGTPEAHVGNDPQDSTGARSAGASDRPRRARSNRACRHEDHSLFHQRGHAHRVACVVREHEEGAAVGDARRRAARCRS